MAFSSTFDVGNINGRNGFTADSGNSSTAQRGAFIDIVGDINNDGIDDLIVNAPRANESDGGLAASYVLFGRDTAFEENVDLSALDGSNGFALSEFVGATGENSNRGFWRSLVSAAGDFNGDGIDDLIVTSPRSNSEESVGTVYVVFGRDTGFDALESLSDLSNEQGVAIRDLGGGLPAVSDAGDINNDGFDDIVIGAGNKSYIIFGSSAGFGDDFGLENLDGSNGFVFEDGGTAVSSAGDFDGDGIDDVLVSNTDANEARGESYVILGKDTGFEASLTRADLNAGDGFIIKGFDAGSDSGYSVSSAGDVNGDGFDDVVVGAPRTGEFIGVGLGGSSVTFSPGAAYVIFGRSAEENADIELSELDGSDGFVFLGIEKTGLNVAGAGDVNNDGVDDVLISTGEVYLTSFSGSYVVFGKTTGFEAELRSAGSNPDPSILTLGSGSGGGIIPGPGGDVAGGGDINGDGVDDFAVLSNRGLYTVFGQDEASAVPVVNLSPANIYVADGTIVGDAFGAGESYQGLLLSNTDGSINENDAIAGTPSNDNIWAGTAGNDSIASGDGNDIIGFGDGNIRVSAGSGNDLVYAISNGAGDHEVDLGSGNDDFYALAGNNTITGSGNNLIAVGSGRDFVTTQDGDDFVYSIGAPDEDSSNTLRLGGGNNTVWLQTGRYDISTGDFSDSTDSGADVIGLGSGTHSVSTRGGDDIIYMATSDAINGDNTLRAGDGDDYIQSGSGDDVLSGGKGINALYGGAGSDTFLGNVDGYAFIGDFEAGIDQIEIGNSIFSSTDLFDEAGLTFSQGSLTGDRTGNAFIYSGGNNILEIANTTLDTLFESA